MKENSYGNEAKAYITKETVNPVSLMSKKCPVRLRAIEQYLIILADFGRSISLHTIIRSPNFLAACLTQLDMNCRRWLYQIFPTYIC